MSSPENLIVCACGKNNLNINPINWLRHVNACKIDKIKQNNLKISTFFVKLLQVYL